MISRCLIASDSIVTLNASATSALCLQEEEDEEAVEVEEVEIVNIIQQKPPPPAIEKISRTEVRTDLSEATKMDTRYFAALLADVYRKNCDIHSCISEHVSKIRGK